MDAISTAQVIPLFNCSLHHHKALQQFERLVNDRTFSALTLREEGLRVWKHVLDDIPLSDSFAWNSIIHTHLSENDPEGALEIYSSMVQRGARPDRRALPRVLAASRLTGKLHFGLQLHGQALKLGFCSDPYVVTGLIEMYGHLGSLQVAHCVFDKSPVRNSVSWTTLAALYMMESDQEAVIRMFYQMVDVGMEIDSVALASAASACGMLKAIDHGRYVHEITRKCRLEDDLLVSNSLIKMYIDCNNVEAGRETFDRMPLKDSISWTEMIRGYVKRGGFNEALKLFRMMNKTKVRPDAVLISGVLPACSRTPAHKNGREIHGYVLKNAMEENVMIQNTLVDMYVKSGSIEYAAQVFERMKVKDAVSWTVILLGFSLHRRGEIGIEYFRAMEQEANTEIEDSVYEAVLHCCATACKVEEGKFYFSCIRKPELTHYALMVALLSRAALFDEAIAFMGDNHMERQGQVLRELLNGCKIHRESKLGRVVIDKLCEVEPHNAENYLLLSYWYSDHGEVGAGDEIRGAISNMGWRNRRVNSWIEYQNKVHAFGTGDVLHPKSRQIYRELQSLVETMGAERQMVSPDYRFHAVEEERKCIQIGHSEMLALAFGLIATSAGRTIRVTKNSHICSSCHDFAKAASAALKREIILKDLNCFHHVKDGRCSCKDLW